MTVYSLSVHAGYACGHSGACCTAGWNIPVEPHRRRLLGADVLVPDAAGRCRFYDEPSRRCRVHHEFGESMLPAACHQFPRRALIDDRGTFITLSHFCPTAARLLVELDGPLSIVTDPVAFPREREYEGLDARNVWPPLLRPDVLLDLDTFSEWERFVVGALAQERSVSDALAAIESAAETLRDWTPRVGTLHAWTTQVLADAPDGRASAAARHRGRHRLEPDAFERLCSTIPEGLERPVVPENLDASVAEFVAPAWDALARPIRRYLAAKAFASWTAYEARGIRTAVAELHLAARVLEVEAARQCEAAQRPLDRALLIQAIRASDHLLMHLADRAGLMTWLGKVEHLR